MRAGNLAVIWVAIVLLAGSLATTESALAIDAAQKSACVLAHHARQPAPAHTYTVFAAGFLKTLFGYSAIEIKQTNFAERPVEIERVIDWRLVI